MLNENDQAGYVHLRKKVSFKCSPLLLVCLFVCILFEEGVLGGDDDIPDFNEKSIHLG